MRVAFFIWALVLVVKFGENLRMKKNQILFAGAVFVVILSSSFYFTSKDRLSIKTSPEAISVANSTKLIDQAKKHPGLTEARLSPEEKASAVCRPVLEAIETMPLDTLIYDLTNGQLNLSADCLFQKKNEAMMLKDFPQSCEMRVEGKPTQICVQQLFFYKAMRIDRATVGDSMDSLPTEILLQKLVAVIGHIFDGATPEALTRFREITLKVRERLPDSPSANKAALMSALLNDQPSPEEKANYENELTDAREKFPNDWDIFEIDLTHKKEIDPEKYKQAVSDFYESHPESPIAIYHMGCVRWGAGASAEAQALFKQAADRAPNEGRFKETYQKSLTAASGDTVCSLTVNLDPDKF